MSLNDDIIVSPFFKKNAKKKSEGLFIKSMLSEEELNRYDRQILIPEIGREGQEKLKKEKVFVAGPKGLAHLFPYIWGCGPRTYQDRRS